jgi:hypothetical protein
MTRSAARSGRRRTRGSIDRPPSGALRVRVYGGVDPLTGKARYLVETIPKGPYAQRLAEKARTRLLVLPRDSASIRRIFTPTIFSAASSNRAKMRPARPRATASGLSSTNVRSTPRSGDSARIFPPLDDRSDRTETLLVGLHRHTRSGCRNGTGGWHRVSVGLDTDHHKFRVTPCVT